MLASLLEVAEVATLLEVKEQILRDDSVDPTKVFRTILCDTLVPLYTIICGDHLLL